MFGETGRRVYLTGLDADASYQITGPGEVRFTTGGVSSSTPWKGLPESGTVRVLVDAYGRVPEDAVQTTLDTVETWLTRRSPSTWAGGRTAAPILKAPGLSRCTTPASTPTASPSPSSPTGTVRSCLGVLPGGHHHPQLRDQL